MAIIKIHLKIKSFKKRISKTMDGRIQKYIQQSLASSNTYFHPIYELKAQKIFLNFMEYTNYQKVVLGKFQFYIGKSIIFPIKM